MNDESFSSLLSLGSLEAIYTEFFKTSNGLSSMEQLDSKNRAFKDLFNIYNESLGKFHEMFVSNSSQRLKIEKFEETFKQLDKVFSQDEDDRNVLDDLRLLSDT